MSPTLNLNISASNPGGDGTSKVYTSVHVTIQDINDNNPLFENLPRTVEMPENTEIGNLPLFTVKAVDPDLGNNGTVLFSLLTENSPFTLTSSTGELFLALPLDREAESSYSLHVSASDQGYPLARTSSSVLEVEISDINDNAPLFYPVSYFESVPDHTPEGTTVVQVSTIDADQETDDADIRYSIQSGNEAERFEIDEIMGVISTSQELKIEDGTLYQLTISAIDGFGNGFQASNTATVRISVTPDSSNIDSGLSFSENPYFFYLLENKRYVNFGQVVIEKSDDMSDANVMFEIIAGDPNGKFQINGQDGKLGLGSNRLNREVASFYNLTVAAVQNDSLMLTCAVEVFVMDMNDHAPLWPNRVIDIFVDETVPINSTVATLEAKDGDQENEVFYTLLTDSSVFKLEENKLMNLVSLEPFVETILDVEILAFDNGVPALSSSVTLSVHVRDVNNHHPAFDPNENSYVFTISEHLPANSVIFQFKVADEDFIINSQLHFSVHPHSNPFRVSSVSLPFAVFPDGELYLSRPLDDENLRLDWYEFYVTAADKGTPSLWSTEKIWVYVTDLNDNPPVLINENFITAHLNSSNQPNTLIGQLVVVDKDKSRNGKTVFSSLSPNQTKFFRIDVMSGELFTTIHFDHNCHGTEYHFKVEAADFGIPSKNSSFFVTIKLLFEDIENISRVRFSQDVFHAKIHENNEANDEVFFLTVKNPTSDGISVYEFGFAENVSSDITDLFDLNKDTGVLRAKVALDRESNGSILRIAVQLRQFIKNEVVTDQATIVVTILDLNDNKPFWRNQNPSGRTFNVREDLPLGSLIGHIPIAEDPDIGANSLIEYEFSDPVFDDTFLLSPFTGDLYLRESLDHEKKRTYEISILAMSDSNTGTASTMTSSITVTVSVTNVNDDPPLIVFPESSIEVSENIGMSQIVTEFSVSDDYSTQLTCELITISPVTHAAQNTFQVNPSCNKISTSRSLDFETTPVYTLKLIACDEDVICSEKDFAVVVIDENDNKPQILSSQVQIASPSDTSYSQLFKIQVKVLYFLPSVMIHLPIKKSAGDLEMTLLANLWLTKRGN